VEKSESEIEVLLIMIDSVIKFLVNQEGSSLMCRSK